MGVPYDMEGDLFYVESWQVDNDLAMDFISFQNKSISKGIEFTFTNPPFSFYEETVYISFTFVDVNVTKYGEIV